MAASLFAASRMTRQTHSNRVASSDHMRRKKAMSDKSTLARSIAPEDIKIGTYVMTLHRCYQIPMSKCSVIGDPEIVIIPVIMRPFFTELPSKVVQVCLPYIVVERENRKTDIIDTRVEMLAVVSKDFGKAARKSHLPKKTKKPKKSKKTQKKKQGKKSKK